jgi:hypothetical protein
VPLAVDLERRGAATAVAHATDVSMTGVRLHLASRLSAGEVVDLRMALPGEPGVVTARGRVSWCEEPPASARARFVEAGVRFEVLSEPDRERIARFVRSFEAAPSSSG